MSPSFYIGRAANMKSNEPKSSAAAACPASARNTGGKERKGEREQDEGGRERARERENKMRAIECRAKIHVGHSNSPTSLLPSSIFSCIFFISALFCEKRKPLFLPSCKSKVTRVCEAQGAVWICTVPVPKLVLQLLQQSSTFHSPSSKPMHLITASKEERGMVQD